MTEDGLEAVLAAIRADLRRGDYARLDRHAATLDRCLAGLGPLSKPVLARVLRAAEGNAACLEAAFQGLRAAGRRLDEIASASRGGAYDAQGRRKLLEAGDRRLKFGSNTAEFPMSDQERLNPRRV